MATRTPATAAPQDDEDLANVEGVEQLCNRMSQYDPCFRTTLIQHHLKRHGITCNDERFVKLLSLSFETMIRSMLADCTRVNRENPTPSKTLSSDLLSQTLLNLPSEQQTQISTDSQQNTMSTMDVNDLFDL